MIGYIVGGVLLVLSLFAAVFVAGARRARDSILRDIKQAPTPEQARIEVQSQKQLEQIDQQAEEDKANVSKLQGEPLRRTFVDRMFRR